MANTEAPPVSAADQMINGVKFVGNMAIMPGIGQIVEGSLGKGVLYGVSGIAASVVVGPLGWIAAGLDSYSLSSSGKHLWELVSWPRSWPRVAAGSPSTADSPSPAKP